MNQEFTINVENINDSPEFTSDPVESVLEDEEYSYAVTAEDLDEVDVLTISGEYPDWLMLVNNGDGTALLSGTPTNDDVGDHSIVLLATDNFGATDQQTFTLGVENTNDPPNIVLPSTFSFDEGSSLTEDFSEYIIDIDEGDSLILTVSETIDFITVDIDSLIVVFGVTNHDVSGVGEMMFYVTDGIDSDSANVSVLVSLVNDNPVLTDIDAQETQEDNENVPLVILLSANDVDNTYNYLSFSAESDNDSVDVSVPSGAPNQAEDDPQTALDTLTIETTGDFYGSVNISVFVSDGFLSDTSVFELTVNPVNDTPVISGQIELASPEDIPLLEIRQYRFM